MGSILWVPSFPRIRIEPLSDAVVSNSPFVAAAIIPKVGFAPQFIPQEIIMIEPDSLGEVVDGLVVPEVQKGVNPLTLEEFLRAGSIAELGYTLEASGDERTLNRTQTEFAIRCDVLGY